MTAMKTILKSLLLPLLVCAPLSAFAVDVEWIKDKRGCKVANIFPQAGESILWNGPCKKSFAHGKGKLTWYIDGEKKQVYEGQMVQGWAEGKGKLTRKDGVYEGDWKHSLQNGYGHYAHEDGSWYVGDWLDGHPHGHGQMRTPDGRLFSGNWFHGEYENERAPLDRT